MTMSNLKSDEPYVALTALVSMAVSTHRSN